jgi:hypothetical protein
MDTMSPRFAESLRRRATFRGPVERPHIALQALDPALQAGDLAAIADDGDEHGGDADRGQNRCHFGPFWGGARNIIASGAPVFLKKILGVAVWWLVAV